MQAGFKHSASDSIPRHQHCAAPPQFDFPLGAGRRRPQRPRRAQAAKPLICNCRLAGRAASRANWNPGRPAAAPPLRAPGAMGICASATDATTSKIDQAVRARCRAPGRGCGSGSQTATARLAPAPCVACPGRRESGGVVPHRRQRGNQSERPPGDGPAGAGRLGRGRERFTAPPQRMQRDCCQHLHSRRCDPMAPWQPRPPGLASRQFTDCASLPLPTPPRLPRPVCVGPCR